MPTLHWIGKEKVVNHHQNVPFRIMEHKYGYSGGTQSEQPTASGSRIIHGDNLEALKSLLPEYEGRVKCIYIDPPYNTGNEGWVYNDNVNDPKIRRWLGQVVGKEAEDLSRHDKWLCMMYPRLKLLHKLLADDGAIFISIDDNEQANLKLICDEIFGANNYVAVFPWRKRTAKSDVPHGVSQDYESIICYSKSQLFRVGIEGGNRKYYETDDLKGKPWRIHDLTTQRTAEERPNSNFIIINPNTGEEFPANPLRTWAVTKETFDIYYNQNRIVFPGDYDFLKISKPVLRYFKEDDIKKAGDKFGLVSVSTNLPKEIGMTQDGTKEITQIFGEKIFSFPKPSSLIEFLTRISTNFDDIILDSFAGSGTTAHAVLNLNKADGGNRKFILIEMEDYAETITAERVKRVIKGYADKEGTGGSFDFYELGQPMFKDAENLNEELGEDKIREYIYYTETKQHLERPQTPEHRYLLDTYNYTGYYFYYEKDRLTTLSMETLKIVSEKAESYLIYADTCLLPKDYMLAKNITFKKIPRDIRKF